MSVIQVRGLKPLKGELTIQGSKNAVLPMLAVAFLHRGVTVLRNVPRIRDAAYMTEILESLDCHCRWQEGELTVDAKEAGGNQIPEYYVTSMRSSVLFLSALLGRTGEGISSYPGGCLIGARPIDLHLKVLKAFGGQVEETEGKLHVSCKEKRGLVGADIDLPYPSVGATEQAIIAAVAARGDTRIRGAAREPEILQLCTFLNNMGASIEGGGESCLKIQGGRKLHDSCYEVEGDRIVAGTYGAAAAAAGGEILLRGIDPGILEEPLKALRQAGVFVREDPRGKQILLKASGRPRPLKLETGPYPAFPTDLQSPFMAFLSAGQGESMIREKVFEGRFRAALELQKMGAEIRIEGQTAWIQGHYPLKGAEAASCDLRGGAALIVAALAAEGTSEIRGCRHIERGYEDICRDLQLLGADAKWTKRQESFLAEQAQEYENCSRKG